MADISPARVPGFTHLQRLYAAILCIADWTHVHRVAVCAAGAPLVTLAAVAIGRLVLLDFPNSGDEYAYLYQAQTMAAGRLWNPAPASPELFVFNYIVQEPGRTLGSFPPGWPLALALGYGLHLPPWLVNPLIGTLTLGLVWRLGWRLYSPRVGVLAAALVGISPFFLFNAASYFSHTFCGALLLAAACLAAREDRAPMWVPVVTGLLVGWAVLARYFTGAVCAIPIVLWLLRPGVARFRTAVLVGLGGIPWMAALVAYNTAISGSPWRLTTRPLTVSLWFADGFVLRGADMLASHLLRHLLWTPPALVVAYVIYLWVAPRDTRRGAFDWMLVLMAATLYSYVERGGNQYGPRFHYEAFLFMALFVAANVFREAALREKCRRGQVLFGLVAASVAVMPVSFGVHAGIERQVVGERMDPYTAVRNAGLQNALVLIGGRVGTTRSMAAADLTRNGTGYDGSVLYGLDPGETERCAPGMQLPGRTTYLYVWDHAASRGSLRRLACSPPATAGR